MGIERDPTLNPTDGPEAADQGLERGRKSGRHLPMSSRYGSAQANLSSGPPCYESEDVCRIPNTSNKRWFRYLGRGDTGADLSIGCATNDHTGTPGRRVAFVPLSETAPIVTSVEPPQALPMETDAASWEAWH